MNQPFSFKQGIARIFKTDQQIIVGSGVLTSQKRVLTCAHVVQSALGLLDNQRENIKEGIRLQIGFPFLTELPSPIAVSLSLIDWHHDVAILKLPNEIKLAKEPQPFVELKNGEMPDVWEHRIRVFGFPEGNKNGAWSLGKLTDSLANGYYQLEGESIIGKAIEAGFSGAPVWDEKLGRVAGMLVRAGNKPEERIAYMIPASLLNMIVAELPTNVVGNYQAYRIRQNYLKRLIDKVADIEDSLEGQFVNLTLMISNKKGRIASPSTSLDDKYHDLAELVESRQEQVFILLGAPGSGKTTLLKRMWLQAARLAQVDNVQPLPLYVQLNQYYDAAIEPLEWLKKQWVKKHRDGANHLPFGQLLNDGKVLLLLDGLNEIPYESRRELKQKTQVWSDFLEDHLGHSRAIFSCRSNDYSARFEAGCLLKMQQVQVEPLAESKILDFLKAYRPYDAQAIWDQIKAESRTIALYSTPFFLRILIEQLDDAGEIPKGKASLITGFIRLALWREVVERDNQYLEDSGLLTELDIEAIEERAWGASPFTLPALGVLIDSLADLAYQMQIGGGSDGGSVSYPKQKAMELLPVANAHDIIKAGIQLNILVQEPSVELGHDIRFTHQLFQEYFAAKYYLATPDPSLVKVDLSNKESFNFDTGPPTFGTPQTGWEETLLLVMEMINEGQVFELYLKELMSVNLLFSARCALLKDDELATKLEQELFIQLIQNALKESNDPRIISAARWFLLKQIMRLGFENFVDTQLVELSSEDKINLVSKLGEGASQFIDRKFVEGKEETDLYWHFCKQAVDYVIAELTNILEQDEKLSEIYSQAYSFSSQIIKHALAENMDIGFSYQKALIYLNFALEHAINAGLIRNQLHLLMELALDLTGEYDQSLKNFDQALNYYAQSRAIYFEHPGALSENEGADYFGNGSFLYKYIGQELRDWKKLEKALFLSDEEIQLRERNESEPMLLIAAYLDASEVAYELERLTSADSVTKSACDYLNLAHKLAKETDLFRIADEISGMKQEYKCV